MDVAVANYVEKERPQLDIKRVEKGKYTISNVNVSLRLNDGEIQVKSGSVLYITLTEYLTIKLQNIGATLLDIASNSPEGKAAAKKKKLKPFLGFNKDNIFRINDTKNTNYLSKL